MNSISKVKKKNGPGWNFTKSDPNSMHKLPGYQNLKLKFWIKIISMPSSRVLGLIDKWNLNFFYSKMTNQEQGNSLY